MNIFYHFVIFLSIYVCTITEIYNGNHAAEKEHRLLLSLFSVQSCLPLLRKGLVLHELITVITTNGVFSRLLILISIKES